MWHNATLCSLAHKYIRKQKTDREKMQIEMDTVAKEPYEDCQAFPCCSIGLLPSSKLEESQL